MESVEKTDLAEWMTEVTPGTHYIYIHACNTLVVIVEGVGGRKERVPWNPDKKYEQFAEVWKKLNVWQKQAIVISVVGNSMSSVLFADAILDDLPKVMKAVMEVIN